MKKEIVFPMSREEPDDRKSKGIKNVLMVELKFKS